MKYLLFILFPFILSAGDGWDKIKHRDDILHIDGSWGITMVTTEIVYHFTRDGGKSIKIGCLTSLGVGIIGKEIIYDKLLGKGTFNKVDIFYNVWGTVIGVIVEICWIDYRENKNTRKVNNLEYKKHILD